MSRCFALGGNAIMARRTSRRSDGTMTEGGPKKCRVGAGVSRCVARITLCRRHDVIGRLALYTSKLSGMAGRAIPGSCGANHADVVIVAACERRISAGIGRGVTRVAFRTAGGYMHRRFGHDSGQCAQMAILT